MSEELFSNLRFGFQAGYTLPQFCIVNGIRNPLFVLKKTSELFLKEIYAQFYYDRRLFPRFCFIDADKKDTIVWLNGWLLNQYITIKRISEMNIDAFDKIILLTKKELNINSEKILVFNDLERVFLRQAYLEIPLLHFLQRYPKVKLFHVKFADIPERYEGGAEFRKQLWDEKDLVKTIRENKNEPIKTPFDKFGYTNAQVLELLKEPGTRRNADGTSVLFDDNSPIQKIYNGKRMTAYQPDNYLNKIYFVGPSHYLGLCAPFDKTIASYLQKILNENNLPYRVENEGQLYFNRFIDMFYNLNGLNPAPNDIIFFHVWHEDFKSDLVPFIDLSDVFDPPYDYKEVFCTQYHVNELGYKIIAERFFEILTQNNFFQDKEFKYPPPPAAYFLRYGIPSQFEDVTLNSSGNMELETYKQTLREKKLPVGALVMNCNPFTFGHLHLVEYAAAKVVKLYIFVVEEDKSEFPFADRIELVRQGVKDFSNVEVLPSGKFIISQTTFSGYFNKASLQDVAVDSSEDVEIFGKEIAPTLGITVRFAGEEPKDNVTRQYNETMKRILPRYGVEFCEIPRKEFSGEPISASTVRAALKNGDIDKVKNFVPDTTFNYLREHHHEFRRYFTARVNIKLMTTEGDFQIISISDYKTNILKPDWFQQDGIGYQIQSCAGKLEFVVKATVDGQIQLYLMGLDIRRPEDNSQRIPYWIDYTKLTINEQIIFDTVTPVWHDKSYSYNMNVKADEEIKIQIEWLPHNN